jgi:hypothetical protein
MGVELMRQYSEIITRTPEHELRSDPTIGGRLVMATDGPVSISYAPFDYITPKARIVIVGITPGAQQAGNALAEARRQLLAGAPDATALRAAKVYASFSGPMRTNLVAMLDHIGLNRKIAVMTTADLWSHAAELVHFTSALRYPVFVAGENYSSAPSMTRTPILRGLITSCLAEEAAKLSDAVWVPLGPKPEEAIRLLVTLKLLGDDQVLSGLPHPSGANAERIAYFLGRKDRADLSNRTSPVAIDRARDRLTEQVARLRL